MDVVAVLCEVFAVAGVKGESVAAGLQLGHIVVALPVFVARAVVWVEAKVIGAFEALLGHGWNADGKEVDVIISTVLTISCRQSHKYISLWLCKRGTRGSGHCWAVVVISARKR